MNKFFKLKNKVKTHGAELHSTSGFTLIETLVAISIFSVSILALFAVISQNIANISYSKKRVVAEYLAQEGIEYIRNVRDTYGLYSSDAQTGWISFNNRLLAANCHLANGCYFDARNVSFSDSTLPITDLILTPCSASNCSDAPLLYDSATGKYGYVPSATTINSGYSRKIFLILSSSDELKFSSTVYWTQGSGTYSVVFSESLFNWLE